MSMQYKLSFLIPARNEEFLKNTVEDILSNTSEDTEIIVGLDGEWSNPSLEQHPRLTVIYVPESIGQRKMTNLCARLSRAKYVIKCDAHCSFDKDFDKKMIEGFEKNGDNVTMVGIMKNLHCYSWKCYKCGHKEYQDRVNICPVDKSIMRKKMVWEPRRGINSTSYSFDSEPHFAYFEDYKHREPYLTDKKTGYTESMSLQGSFYMMTREKYLKLMPIREEFGSWGNEGAEIACYTWLTGGRVLVNHNTWYSHMFRTKGDVFGFPYPQSGKHVSRTKQRVWDTILNGKMPGQIYPVSWLVKKFWPVNGWTQEALDSLIKSESIKR